VSTPVKLKAPAFDDVADRVVWPRASVSDAPPTPVPAAATVPLTVPVSGSIAPPPFPSLLQLATPASSPTPAASTHAYLRCIRSSQSQGSTTTFISPQRPVIRRSCRENEHLRISMTLTSDIVQRSDGNWAGEVW